MAQGSKGQGRSLKRMSGGAEESAKGGMKSGADSGMEEGQRRSQRVGPGGRTPQPSLPRKFTPSLPHPGLLPGQAHLQAPPSAPECSSAAAELPSCPSRWHCPGGRGLGGHPWAVSRVEATAWPQPRPRPPLHWLCLAAWSLPLAAQSPHLAPHSLAPLAHPGSSSGRTLELGSVGRVV